MTARVLPRSEWPRLTATAADLGAVCQHLPPQSEILIVEDDGAIVGCWSVMPILHAEGIWIQPAYRSRAGVLRQLLRGMSRVVRALGHTHIITGATDAATAAMLRRRGGAPMPGEQFAIPIEERPGY